ncbi:KR domain-containing protein [Streptomyces alkaliphilus]|uniref:KR domain-containing protein n=1 Tax=Streptomyces alkaliphilus TaxID=1472722 RepID=A0A7W3Y151_9ACTN|nr:type I polyketide synthase [Streptomyces alkaliphilus]MBB0244168.1 KR domain-containing protein [Streptomyces alkaliphilus]
MVDGPDGTAAARALAALLEAAGGEPTIAGPDDAVCRDVSAQPGESGLTVVVLTEGGADPAETVRRVTEAVTVRADAPDTAALLVATRGARVVTAGESADPAQAAVAVLPVVAGQEYPGLDVRGVDLDPAGDPARDAADLADALGVTGGPVLTAYRGGVRYIPDYRSVPETPAASHTPAVRAGGSYLVTGGLGVIGLVVAEHLVRGGAGRVVLAGRAGLAADATGPRAEAVARLRALGGARVETPKLDVTDSAAIAALLGEERFTGVLHAAGDTAEDAFGPLATVDADGIRRHFGAKYRGALAIGEALDTLPAELAPAWVLLFSSTSAHLGGIAFGGYAAANAALEALARPTDEETPTRWISAAWDTWIATLARTEERTAGALAAYAMTDARALAALDAVVTGPLDTVVIAAGGGWEDRLPQPPEPASDEESAPALPRPELPQPYVSPLTATERELCELWSQTLGVVPVGTRDNFFDLGGSSFSALQMLATVRRRFGRTVPAVVLFESPTVRGLAAVLDGADQPAPVPAPAGRERPVPVTVRTPGPSPVPTGEGGGADPAETDRRIAVVGMAGRFPGAGDVGTFWQNLLGGVETITFFTPEELIEAGVDPELAHDPEYVRARPVLEDIAGFDAGFFGMSPRMAALADPQQRLFLEVCWEALEHAGCADESYRERVGVYGGSNLSTYLLGMVPQLGSGMDVSPYELIMTNDKDALTTTVSYLFDLRGPSVPVQTFCSTSLVAVHTAVRSLRAGECEVALAGGVSIGVPDRRGHRRQPGGMDSHDGHVHSFDADATGTMFGDGATVVVLKRLSDALRDGDTVHAVIRGSALNNDGALKAGYTAPSVVGQAAAVRDALVDAGVTASDIGYVEAHGSATELGDPIEVAALTRAYGAGDGPGTIPIGAVKTNVGHLNHAAGTAGLIKTALTVRDGVIPASLNYTRPNPQIDFAAGPFYVNTTASGWSGEEGRPRIAGVNSLGMGGTNVHVVVEEPPAQPERGPENRRHHVVAVSARTEQAAEESVRNLATFLDEGTPHRISDIAHTLHVGRKTFEHRRAAVVTGTAHAAAVLSGTDDRAAVAGRVETASGRPVALLLAGVGEQYPGMVGDLHRHEPVFRAELDAVLELLAPWLPETDLTDLLTGDRPRGGGDMDLAALLGRATGDDDPRTAELERTEVVQPLMFAVDYALARTLIAWGVRPALILGYSLGEYAAACLAGVLSPADAVALVVHRARLISGAESGGMAAVPLGADELRGRYRLDARGLDIAAVNGPAAVVVAGPQDALDGLIAVLERDGVPARALRTTHAFHSRMLEPLAEQLTSWVAENITLNPPSLPYLSNVTGDLADAALVRDPAYWAAHMCRTVRFAEGAQRLLEDQEPVIVEIGPGPSLGAMVRGAGCPPERWPLITATLPAQSDPRPSDEVLTECVSRLWLTGVELDWAAYHGRGAATAELHRGAPPRRVPLPTYPFQRQRYWIEPTPLFTGGAPATTAGNTPPEGPASFEDLDRVPRLPEEEWLWQPVWRQTAVPAPAPAQPAHWLVYSAGRAAERILAALRAAAGPEVRVSAARPGTGFTVGGDGEHLDYTLRPGDHADARAMLRDLRGRGPEPERVVHLWTLDAPGDGADPTDATVELGLHTLVALAHAAGDLGLEGWSLDLVTSGAHPVLDGVEARPEAATLVGPALVVPLEYPGVTTRLLDVAPATPAAVVVEELRRPRTDATVALRGTRRWVAGYEALPGRDAEEAARTVLREEGVYLITGGLGGIGLAMAERLAASCRARLVLLGRRGLPPRERWEAVASGAEHAEESMRERVVRVLDLVRLGAEVEVVEGDVSVNADVRRAVETARERFGALHGVLHAAGVPGTGLMQFKQPADSDLVLAPKVGGARAIAEALRIDGEDEVELDFLALFSSITSATGGGPGQVDYCAANAYLDGFAARLAAGGRRAVSVAWGEWTWNAWDFGLAGYDDQLQSFFRSHRETFGIGFDEGWRSLLRALSAGEPRVVVSTQDLPTMVRYAAGFTVEAVLDPTEGGQGGGRHPRPELLTPYREPSGPAESSIAEVWRDQLKLERVGVRDNFFELGGNSLLGIALLAKLRKVFPGAELPPHVLYEAPTVEALAKLLDGSPAADRVRPGPDAGEQGRRRRSGLKTAAARRRRAG